MGHTKVQSAKQDAARGRQQTSAANQVGVVRLEIKQGEMTKNHQHETECLVIVLAGAWRVYVRGRAVTVRENEMLHIPPQHDHFAEALEDTVALSISPSASEWSGCGPFVHEDPYQNLWGV
jgi:quercetin dioxygenase-like cupin family protein